MRVNMSRVWLQYFWCRGPVQSHFHAIITQRQLLFIFLVEPLSPSLCLMVISLGFQPPSHSLPPLLHSMQTATALNRHSRTPKSVALDASFFQVLVPNLELFVGDIQLKIDRSKVKFIIFPLKSALLLTSRSVFGGIVNLQSPRSETQIHLWLLPFLSFSLFSMGH